MKGLATLLTVILGLSTTAKADWIIGGSVGYSPNYMANLSGTGTNSGTPYSSKYTLDYDGTAEFGVDVWNTYKNSWGFISGFQYGGERKSKSGTVNGFPLSSSDDSKYQTHFLYAGTAYRWESFYIPLGLTYGVTKFTSAKGTTASSLEVKNGIGALLGLGWFINDHFVIEYIGRSTTTELNASGSSFKENNTGTIASAVLNLKFFY